MIIQQWLMCIKLQIISPNILHIQIYWFVAQFTAHLFYVGLPIADNESEVSHIHRK